MSGIIGGQMFGDLLKNVIGRIFKLAALSTVWKQTHACSINGSINDNLAILTRFAKLSNHHQINHIYSTHTCVHTL